ncbi:MAG: hypothetical protein LBG71_01870 [Clostridiales Family XIII bacterium]|jgi:hypothetical protein|nr:hypothetical protein [Clostridiales Family XIII bacterium]
MALANGATSAAPHLRNAPEYRYKYDRNIHYEVNLRPDPEPKRAAAPAAARKEKRAPVWDKLNVYVLILLAGVLGVACVISNTWANEIQKEINQTLKSTKETREDIEGLVIRINRGLDVKTIETRAAEELGMSYPLPEQYVYLQSTPEIADFGQYIKESAYEPFKGEPLAPLRALRDGAAETWETLGLALAPAETGGTPVLTLAEAQEAKPPPLPVPTPAGR